MSKLMVFLFFGSVASFVMYLLSPTEEQLRVKRRLEEMKIPRLPEDVEEAQLSLPFWDRVLVPQVERLRDALLRFTPAGMKRRWERDIRLAGEPVSLASFVGIKFLAGLTCGATGVMILLSGQQWSITSLASSISLAALGVYLPSFWLKRRIDARRQAIVRNLPDVLDLLSVSVEAGLGFDGAVQKVSEKFTGPVGEEFRFYLKEVRLGSERERALRNMVRRTEVSELRSFVAAIVQAEKLGVAMTKVLRLQAEQMRFRRRQRAEEEAAKLPVKMVFPLVFFIFPVLFIILLGPLVIRILRGGFLG